MTRKEYDKRVWAFLLTCTGFVMLCMLVAISLTTFSAYWLLLPGSWLVGGGMTWAFDRYMNRAKKLKI